MGRIRTIKPEFPQSESMGKISREARLLFIQIWTLVDDQGRTRAASRMLASLLYPYDADAPKLIDKWLGELEAEKCIVRYFHKGNRYLQVDKWNDHQKIDRPSKPKLPSPQDAETLASPREPSIQDSQTETDTREPSCTDQDLDQDQGRDLGKDQEELVQRAFVYYCTLLNRNPKQYSLTDERKRKALLRVGERLEVHDGDLEAVAGEFKLAIKNLSASEFHRTKGYLDWNEQIFRSQEEFEKRINWVKPQGDSNGRNFSKTGGNLDAGARAVAFFEQAERDSQAIDEVQPAERCGGDGGNLDHLRAGSIDL